MHVLRLLAQHLPSLKSGHDLNARAELMLAAVLCGQGTDHTGAGMTTVLGHAIGARNHMDNGIANAIVLAHVLRFNGTTGEGGLQKVATALGLARSDGERLVTSVAGAVEALFGRLDVPCRLRDVGIARETLSEIAGHAIGDWFLRGNPRPVRSEAELLQVLEQAW